MTAPPSSPAHDRRVLMAIPVHDYGDPARGQSFETHFWVPAVAAHVRDVEVLPFDRAMHEPGSLDDALLGAVDRLQPDLVMFFPFRDDVGLETLRAVRERTATLAFRWDDAWRFEDYSSRYAALYDFTVTTEPAVAPRYLELGGTPIVTTYGAARTERDLPPPVAEDAYRHDVSFVGGANPWRAWLVDWLGRQGVHVECYGADWPNGRVTYSEMDAIFRTSRINLNISNSRQHDTRFLLADPRNFLANRGTPKNAEQIKARHFEIGMAGGCQLSYYAVGIEDHLQIGRELAIYTTPEDLLVQIRRLLAEPARRRGIAEAAWRRCRAEHTYEGRVGEWLAAVWPDEARRPAAA